MPPPPHSRRRLRGGGFLFRAKFATPIPFPLQPPIYRGCCQIFCFIFGYFFCLIFPKSVLTSLLYCDKLLNKFKDCDRKQVDMEVMLSESRRLVKGGKVLRIKYIPRVAPRKVCKVGADGNCPLQQDGIAFLPCREWPFWAIEVVPRSIRPLKAFALRGFFNLLALAKERHIYDHRRRT